MKVYVTYCRRCWCCILCSQLFLHVLFVCIIAAHSFKWRHIVGWQKHQEYAENVMTLSSKCIFRNQMIQYRQKILRNNVASSCCKCLLLLWHPQADFRVKEHRGRLLGIAVFRTTWRVYSLKRRCSTKVLWASNYCSLKETETAHDLVW